MTNSNQQITNNKQITKYKIDLKEAKETSYWLDLLKHSNLNSNIDSLIQETKELRNTLSLIISKVVK